MKSRQSKKLLLRTAEEERKWNIALNSGKLVSKRMNWLEVFQSKTINNIRKQFHVLEGPIKSLQKRNSNRLRWKSALRHEILGDKRISKFRTIKDPKTRVFRFTDDNLLLWKKSNPFRATKPHKMQTKLGLWFWLQDDLKLRKGQRSANTRAGQRVDTSISS